MSHGHFDPTPHYQPKAAPAQLMLGAKVLVALGVVAFLAGLFLEGYGVRVRAIALVNTVYFLGVSMGGLVFACALQLTWARWGRPLKRIAESFVVFVPILWALLLINLVTGGLDLYEWKTHPETLHAHKAIWLTPTFFVVRQFVGLGLLTVLAFLFLRNSLRPDLGIAARHVATPPAFWGRITADWRGDEAEIEQGQERMTNLAPIVAATFAFVFSFLAFDLLMSLAPHWYSNMFGGWFFASCFWSGMVWVGLISLTSRGWLGIRELITPSVYHDLGKLIFAFSCVWAYMFFAQLLPIWYGNMTEEIGFLLIRMNLEPWATLTKVVAVLCWLLPFTALLSRGVKKMPVGFGIILGLVALGIWLERFVVAVPSVWREASLPLGPLEVLVSLGFLGGFVWSVLGFLSKVPPVPVSDPYMNPHPDDVHVTPHGHGAHAHAH